MNKRWNFHVLPEGSTLYALLCRSTSDKLTLGSLESKFEGFILEILKQKMERIKKKENLGERERKPEDVVTNIASIAG